MSDQVDASNGSVADSMRIIPPAAAHAEELLHEVLAALGCLVQESSEGRLTGRCLQELLRGILTYAHGRITSVKRETQLGERGVLV